MSKFGLFNKISSYDRSNEYFQCEQVTKQNKKKDTNMK